MIPLALAAILEDDEEAIQVHEVWALDLSSLNSFFFLRHTQMQTYLIINMDDIVIRIKELTSETLIIEF